MQNRALILVMEYYGITEQENTGENLNDICYVWQ